MKQLIPITLAAVLAVTGAVFLWTRRPQTP